MSHMDSLDRLTAGRLSARSHRLLRQRESAEQRAYEGLSAARMASGMARLAMGLHLVTLQESGGWMGRTGASSFRRFLLEEGVEPNAAYQYMTVARRFILDNGISPERLALVGMRVLVEASKYVRDATDGEPGNVEAILDLVCGKPGAEALEAIRDRFEMSEEAKEQSSRPRTSRPVASILASVEGLSHDGRAELYRALHLASSQGKPAATSAHRQPHSTAVARRAGVMPPEPPMSVYLQELQ